MFNILMEVHREHSHQDGNDSFKLLLHKITNDLVVKILHRLPLENAKTSALLHLNQEENIQDLQCCFCYKIHGMQ